MQLELRRIILFTADLPRLTAFYGEVIGLSVAGRETGWVSFDAGGCDLALHAGKSVVGSRPPKLVFHAADVSAARTALLARGLAKAGPVKSTATFDMCDFHDPDGNALQLSSRAL